LVRVGKSSSQEEANGKMRNIGKQIKAWRLSKLWTQEKAAHEIGIGVATLQRIEAGASCYELTEARIKKRIGTRNRSKHSKEREDVAA
jgi:DNA-binding XRE family transcriptional regulator